MILNTFDLGGMIKEKGEREREEGEWKWKGLREKKVTEMEGEKKASLGSCPRLPHFGSAYVHK